MKPPLPEILDILLLTCRAFLKFNDIESAGSCLLDYYKWRVRGAAPSSGSDEEAERLGRMLLDQIGIVTTTKTRPPQ